MNILSFMVALLAFHLLTPAIQANKQPQAAFTKVSNTEIHIHVLENWQAGSVVSEAAVKIFGEDKCFRSEAISNSTFTRMRGKSYKEDCTTPRSELRYLRLLHYNGKGQIQLGEMVCNKRIAQDLVNIFRSLYRQRYRIESMVLIDNYNANDELSMQHNNTSCFNFRRIKGRAKLSKHSLGLAVDINPLYNPHVKKNSQGKQVVTPQCGIPYANRSKTFPYRIDHNDPCYKEFKKHGFRWGGAWTHSKDYQHFEK